jgi:hypothetical protein
MTEQLDEAAKNFYESNLQKTQKGVVRFTPWEELSEQEKNFWRRKINAAN